MSDLTFAFAALLLGVSQVLAYAALLAALRHQRTDLEDQRNRNRRLVERLEQQARRRARPRYDDGAATQEFSTVE